MALPLRGSYDEIVVNPKFSFSATLQRRSIQQPPVHHVGRLAQISRMGVVLILPTGGMPKQASTSPLGRIWMLVSAAQTGCLRCAVCDCTATRMASGF